MAACPACNHDVATPFFLNLDAWRWLVCPRCKVRLEMKAPRSAVLAPLVGPLFVLAQRSDVFEVTAFVFVSATICLLLLESFHSRVQLRQRPLPKRAIRLNIEDPSK